MLSANKKPGDRAGHDFEYSFAVGCNDFSFGGFDVEMGVDYREASDMAPRHFADPFQGSAQITYGQRSDRGWSAALGMDHVGLQHGVNNHNRAYLVGQHRFGDWDIVLGGFMGNHKLLVDSSGSSQATGALVGIWHHIGRGGWGIEWASGQNRFGYGFIGAQLRFGERFTGTLGYGLVNDRKNRRDRVLLRLVLQ